MSARVHRTTTRTRDRGGKFASTIREDLRQCDRCKSKETSQWRTGIDGKSLCNPCGIKLKRERDRLLAATTSNNNKKKPSSIHSIIHHNDRPSKRVKTIAVQNLLNPAPPSAKKEPEYYHHQSHNHHHHQQHNHHHHLHNQYQYHHQNRF